MEEGRSGHQAYTLLALAPCLGRPTGERRLHPNSAAASVHQVAAEPLPVFAGSRPIAGDICVG